MNPSNYVHNTRPNIHYIHSILMMMLQQDVPVGEFSHSSADDERTFVSMGEHLFSDVSVETNESMDLDQVFVESEALKEDEIAKELASASSPLYDLPLGTGPAAYNSYQHRVFLSYIDSYKPQYRMIPKGDGERRAKREFQEQRVQDLRQILGLRFSPDLVETRIREKIRSALCRDQTSGIGLFDIRVNDKDDWTDAHGPNVVFRHLILCHRVQYQSSFNNGIVKELLQKLTTDLGYTFVKKQKNNDSGWVKMKDREVYFTVLMRLGAVSVVMPNDILCGQGSRVMSHPGNLNLCKELLLCKKDCRLRNPASEKRRFGQAVNTIRSLSPPGRFLMKNQFGEWYDVGDRIASELVKQCVRHSLQWDLSVDRSISLTDLAENIGVVVEGSNSEPGSMPSLVRYSSDHDALSLTSMMSISNMITNNSDTESLISGSVMTGFSLADSLQTLQLGSDMEA